MLNYSSHNACFLIVTLFYGLSLLHANFDSSLEELYEFAQANKPYQDIIVNNTIFYKGWNTQYCAERYQALYEIFTALQKCTPVKTVLDIGAAQGYFSFRLAHDFKIIPTMLEDGLSALEYSVHGINLLKILHQLNTPAHCQGAVLESTVTRDLLAQLNTFQHFDVVIALSILHFFDDWQMILNEMTRLGDILIIEVTDMQGDISQIKNSKQLAHINYCIRAKGGILVKQISRHYKGQVGNLYLFPPLACI